MSRMYAFSTILIIGLLGSSAFDSPLLAAQILLSRDLVSIFEVPLGETVSLDELLPLIHSQVQINR